MCDDGLEGCEGGLGEDVVLRGSEREEDIVVDLLIKTKCCPAINKRPLNKEVAMERASRPVLRRRNDVTLLPAAWVCLPGWAEAAAVETAV